LGLYLIAKEGTDIHQTANRDKTLFFEDFVEFEAIVRTILGSANLPAR
jgi:hypothetical protein